jgi:protein-L-isoaspartate(D-aspartate) O-methyltransferase
MIAMMFRPWGAGGTTDPVEARRRMVELQIRARGVRDEQVLAAMAAVERHLFVPERYRHDAYADHPWPIGHGQTISQPLMVAVMLEAMRLHGHERVLEVGAGCGYQAALLGRLASEVVALEIVPALVELARENLAQAGANNVAVKLADGSLGYPEGAPFDAIVVAAGAPAVPPPLMDQLADGGRLVIPVGGEWGQELLRVTRRGGRFDQERLGGCAFVPLVGEHGR